jgi:hypothetical protein
MVILHHGTTRRRGESILKNGPDVNFREPGGPDKAEGFSTSPAEGPFPLSSPEDYARSKAALFPDEGGPVILEIEVPEEIASLADTIGGDVRFHPGWGLKELLDAWPRLPKRILEC